MFDPVSSIHGPIGALSTAASGGPLDVGGQVHGKWGGWVNRRIVHSRERGSNGCGGQVHGEWGGWVTFLMEYYFFPFSILSKN
jgi:hypothetical protein